MKVAETRHSCLVLPPIKKKKTLWNSHTIQQITLPTCSRLKGVAYTRVIFKYIFVGIFFTKFWVWLLHGCGHYTSAYGICWFESDAFSGVLGAEMPISVSTQWQCGTRAQVFQSIAPTGVTLHCYLLFHVGLSGAVPAQMQKVLKSASM